MKSTRRGTITSVAEVANVSARGVWIFLGDREVFLPFERFPWLEGAPVGVIANVERPRPHHLHWPDLDVDVDLDSIDHPEAYPLVSRKTLVVAEPGRPKRRSR